MRTSNILLLTALCLGAGATLCGPSPARAVPVDLELSIMVDVSGSISTTEFNLQRGAYANAFKDTDLHALIALGQHQSIAANVIYWSSANEQIEIVPWTQISNGTQASAFGDAIAATVRTFSGGTSISGALTFATPRFNNNGFEGDRLVMDISGDGTNASNPSGVTLASARTNALAVVDTINGIVIESASSNTLFNHYRDFVIGGTDAFVRKATTFESFEPAILEKLRTEIAPPENPPVVNDNTINVFVGNPVNYTFTGSDLDGDTLTWLFVGLTPSGANAPTFDPATQQFFWDTTGSALGQYQARASATDPGGLSDTGVLTINVLQQPDPNAVPEPSTFVLAGLGLGGVGLLAWRRRRS